MQNKDNQLPFIHPTFIGMGHTLEKTRKEKKKLREEHQTLEARVTYFHKEARRTMRSISERKKQLEQIIKTRMRRQQEREFKQELKQMKQDYEQRLRIKSSYSKRANQQSRKQALKKIHNKNKTAFLKIKDQLESEHEYMEQVSKQNVMVNEGKHDLIKNNKEMGREQIIQFKKAKNVSALTEYNKRIHFEEEIKDQLTNKIKLLNRKEQLLIQEVQKSQMEHERLKGAIEKGYEIEIETLKDMLNNKPRSKISRRRNSNNSLPMASTFYESALKRRSPEIEGVNGQRSFNLSPKQLILEEQDPEKRKDKKHKKKLRKIKDSIIDQIEF